METQAILISYTNPKGDATINNLEFAALLTYIRLFAPKMHTLAHIRTAVDKTAAQGWANRRCADLLEASGIPIK